MNVDIKIATISDAETISAIYSQSWKEAYRGMVPSKYLEELKCDFWTLNFEEWISTGVFTTKIICEKKSPVGAIAYGKSRDEKYKEFGEIASLYIHPNYYRKGYGNKLLRQAIVELKTRGFEGVYLWVLRENNRARKFYEINGFQNNGDIYEVEIMGEKLIDLRYVFKF